MQKASTEILVIGAGIAGLEAALESVRAGRKTMILTKGACASPAVLGFNAPVSEEDSVDRFCQDTKQGGWNLGNSELIETFARGAKAAVPHMEELGLSFEKQESGEYHLLKPLGCSVPRLMHHQNITGKASMALLEKALNQADVEIRQNCMALSLLKKEDRICGALCLDLATMDPLLISCQAVCLCTGGAHLMEKSTYPLCQTADGFQLAYQAGAALVDMEFIQHEPCRAVWPRPLGISTTLLSKGGLLKNNQGERFVLKEYETEGAAPKDQLARIIAQEILAGKGSEHGGVYLDLTGLPPEEIIENHSLYYHRFMDAGIDLTKEIVEVGPAAHSIMGGVQIQKDASTCVPGLFAAGEVIGGLHGANRLGGNAGAETYVFGRIAGQSAAAFVQAHPANENVPDDMIAAFLPRENGKKAESFLPFIDEIRHILAKAMGPVRCEAHLIQALSRLAEIENACLPLGHDWKAQKARQEALNLCRTGLICCRAALSRKESRGVHFRSDYPIKDDENFGFSQVIAPNT
ncbi:MAG: FAD-binding protein [Clostridia bacterium]|nr:FAD-binding protein [Clostridia bacterium]